MNATFVELAGATLLHSLWQGALIAGLLALTLRLLRGVTPVVRYLVCWAALVAMVAVPVGVVVGGRGGQGGPGGQDGVGMGDFRGVAVQEVGVAEAGSELTTLEEAGFAVQPFLVAFWLVGVLFMLARLGRGWWTVRQLRRLPGEALGEEVLQVVDRLRGRLGISRVVRLVATDRAGEPMLIGWLKPVVLIPTALLAGMPVAHIEAILAHELAHIRRHDYLFAVLQSLFEAVLFYHPAAWWISGKIREERERACDDLAVEAIHSRATYARALAGLEVQRLGGLQLALPAGGGSLLARIQRLVEPPAPDRLRSSAGAVLAVVMVVASGLFVAACSDKTLPGEPLVQDLAALPDELATMIQQADIEGTITYLHERREAGDPEAYQLLLEAFRAAKDLDLRQNMVFVFAYFNTLEADRELIRISETDPDQSVQENAIRAIGLRIPYAPDYGGYRVYALMRELSRPMEYPLMTPEHLQTIQVELRRIAGGDGYTTSQRLSALGALAYRSNEEALLSQILSSSASTEVKIDAIRGLAPPAEKVRLYQAHAQDSDDRSKLQIRMDIANIAPPTLEGLEMIVSFFPEIAMPQEVGIYFGPYFRTLPLHAATSEWPAMRERILEEKQRYAADSHEAKLLDMALAK